MKKMQITRLCVGRVDNHIFASLAKDIEVKVTGSVTPSGCTLR
jgi:hypothetical protein